MILLIDKKTDNHYNKHIKCLIFMFSSMTE